MEFTFIDKEAVKGSSSAAGEVAIHDLIRKADQDIKKNHANLISKIVTYDKATRFGFEE